MSERYGFTVVQVLPELTGKPWCEITQAYLRALRPSKVRVIRDGIISSDARTWRVTVYAPGGIIERIEQEVEVDLPEGVKHGHDLDCRLDKLRSVP